MIDNSKSRKTKQSGGEKEYSRTSNYSISLIVRVAKILTCLSEGKTTLNEITQSTKLSKSTVHRLLNALSEPHFTVYDPAYHQYYLGSLIAQLSSKATTTHKYLISCALDELHYLSERTNETITLSTMIGIQLIQLYMIESKHSLKVVEDLPLISTTLPFGASQKVLLSQLNNNELEFTLNFLRIFSKKRNITIDFEKLEKQLAEINKLGYVISRGEITKGAMAIATPVKQYICPVALTIIGPNSRIETKKSEFSRELVLSSKRLSKKIRHYI
ncbi:MAG: IclR family transcriptional regulator [Promethearchaeota archaeon]